MKKLYKSKKNKFFGGVVGGIGEYFNVDPTILRLVWLFILIFTGIFPGVLAYILACIVIPDKVEK